MFKNVTDWKSTIQGIVVLVVSILVGFGIVTPEQSEILNTEGAVVIAGVAGSIGGVIAIYKVFFAKDTPPAE